MEEQKKKQLKVKTSWVEKDRSIRRAGPAPRMDAAEREKAKKSFEILACYDQLTGVYQRTVFIDKLNMAIKEAALMKWMIAVMVIDIDDFKTVNDIYGHDKGDKFLKLIAKRMKKHWNSREAIISRMGGDEFVLYLTGLSDKKEAELYGRSLLERINKPARIQGLTLQCSASIGITVFPADGEKAKLLMKKSDRAMCKAKEEGKNRLVCFNHSLMRNMRIAYDMQREMSKTAFHQEFYLCFQPIFSVRKNRVHMAEALIRWNHPELGLVNPVDFIPVAEKTRFILPLGEWVLEEACRQAAMWQEEHGMMVVSVNVSPVQLQQPGFSKTVSQILRRYHLKPEHLELEMTETVLVQYDQSVDDNLRALSMMGVGLAIDDFGTGYNSFQCIQINLFDTIKIDRNFVMNIKNEINRTIIHTIICLGHQLNMKITAEGVEQEEESSYLKKAECDLIQGYLIGKPLPGKEFLQSLQELEQRSI